MSDQVVEAGRLASIGELAAGIAHEINNPVAIMVEEAGWIQDLLAEDNPTTPDNLSEIERAVAQIKTQGGRCKEITHKLLSFARKTDPTIKQIDLNEMIREMITLVDQKTRYASVQIETQMDPDLPPFWASATELQQVILNLLNNSVDAMTSSGGIIRISTQTSDGQIILTIADNGIGIAEANLARIFDPFYTTKPVGQGTGLGLSICYGIIKKLGGDIQVQSAKGRGTTFTISLPAAQDKTGGREIDSGSITDHHKALAETHKEE
jgi:two-component system NtrC family sensor kinase